jgi:hypothetical protein
MADANPYVVCWFLMIFIVGWCKYMVCFSDVEADCSVR